MTARIPLERVFDNPFQVRQIYGEIEELAESIRKMKAARPETCGLMQVATGRVVKPNGRGWDVLNPEEYGSSVDGGMPLVLEDEPEAVVQIAFAHRRLRAFHFLAESDPDYQTFPVELVQLTDQQMSDLAWEENSKRKDLTPIEEAEALQQAIELFGYTQEQIGLRWGLSQSAVANKLRLLQLPEEAQGAIRGGQITERHGRALLSALGRSRQIYKEAAEEILPETPASEEATAAARALLEKFKFYATRRPEELHCEACGIELPELSELYMNTYNFGAEDERHYLCRRCYKVGSDWQPPSAGEADKIVGRAISMNQQDLERAEFPLEAEIEAEGVFRTVCTDCPARRGDKCYDGGCFEARTRAWKERLFDLLKERLQADYGIAPEQVTINQGYGGHDLNKFGVDADLVRAGSPCAPGNCERLQFRYARWSSDSAIKPYEDLPFLLQCNHTGAHNAAQRRYLESQQTEEEKSKAVQAEEKKRAKKAEARAAIDNAVASLALGLEQQQDQAWRAVLDGLSIKFQEDDTAEQCLQRLAKKAFYYDYQSMSGPYTEPGWVIENVKKKLERWGIARLPQLTEIHHKLEKVMDFVYGHRIDGEITPEQIEGNRFNLEKLVEQMQELHQAGLIRGKEEVIPILNLVREILDELWEAASEIEQPLPQEWALEIEMELAGIAGIWEVDS